MPTINLKSRTNKIQVRHQSKNLKLTHVGRPGVDGTNGQGVPTGGTAGQILAKNSNTDYDTEWIDDAGAQTYDEYIYNSTGAQEDNRYNDWQDLIDAIHAGQEGPVRITFERAETLPAGNYNLDFINLAGSGQPYALGGFEVTLPDGFNITSWRSGEITNALAIRYTGNDSLVTLSSGINLFRLGTGAYIITENASFFEQSGAATFLLTMGLGANMTNDGYEPVTVNGTGFFISTVEASVTLGNNIFRGNISGMTFASIGVVSSSAQVDPERTDANLTGTLPVGLLENSLLIGFDPTGTALSSTNVQDAIIEIALAGGTFPDAADVSFDDTYVSGLSGGYLVGANVQAIIDKFGDAFASISGGSSEKIVRTIESTNAHGLTVGDWVRNTGGSDGSGNPNRYVKAQADSLANSDTSGVVIQVVSSTSFVLAIAGYVTGISSGSAATLFYLDPDTPGAITPTRPTTNGDVIKPVFFSAGTSGRGYVNVNYEGEVVGEKLKSANNLSDLASASTSRTNLGIGNVDNTSDLNKPISTATQTALDGKVDENIAITGATKTKITYDAKGLVTAGADATQDDIGDGATYKQYSSTEKTKLAGIETGADVTDATNVDAAGATMNSDTSLAGNGYFLDEDNMASDSAVKVPSQQSTKAYADGKVADAINNGTTTIAPSQNAVFDALALKSDTSHTHLLAAGATDVTSSAAELNILDGATLSTTELNYVDGVTSAIQTQLDAKLASSAYDDATSGETDTGTSTSKYVSPDGLAGSYAGTKPVSLEVVQSTTALTTGDGKCYFRIPPSLNGMNLVTVGASVFAKSTSGDPTVQIARGRQANATSAHTFADMLSTRITIDQDEYDSKDATTASVIDTANDDVLTGDLIRIDVDVAGTAATGLYVTLQFRLP